MSCKKWVYEQGESIHYLDGFRITDPNYFEGVPIFYCPFCGSVLNQEGCTKKGD